jgi:hypothetical protein
MLRGEGSTQFLWKYETHMFGGNEQWADPEEAVKVGETVGEELVGRYEHLNRGVYEADSPQVGPCAQKVMEDALKVVDYAALPTERRANILHGVIKALAATGALGGEPEWATDVESTVAASTPTS